MKRFMSSALLALTLCTMVDAAPALRRVLTLTQPDGSTLQAIASGDEHVSLFIDAATGERLVQDAESGYWRAMTDAESDQLTTQWNQARRAASSNIRRLGGVSPKLQSIKVPLILVNFQDTKLTEQFGSETYFQSAMNDMDYERVAYTYNGKEVKTGSFRRFWYDQSYGKFDVTFDILGTVTLDNNCAYYGANTSSARDAKCTTLLSEVISKAKTNGWLDNAKQYDNNNNGNVDAFYIIFAGYGENETGIADQLWAKNTYTSATTKDGTAINLCILTTELTIGARTAEDPNAVAPAFGVMVHEFAHAVGLPDLYSTNASTRAKCYGMDAWDLMDQAEYNGRGQVPSALTAQERMYMGWMEATEGIPYNTTYALEPITTGKALILRNPKNEQEYITLENHQPNNVWDMVWGNGPYTPTPSFNRGLLISHVDLSKWTAANTVNNDATHQGCNPIAADGELRLYVQNDNNFFISYFSDIFPGYGKITTLDASNPLLRWFTGDTIDITITHVSQRSSGNIDITFGPSLTPSSTPIEELPTSPVRPSGIIYQNGRFMVNGYSLSGKRERW